MSIKVFVVLVVVGVALYVFKWRRTGYGFLALACAVFVCVGCGWLPTMLLQGLQEPYARRPHVVWAPRSAVVLLGAGTVRTTAGTVGPMLFAFGRILEALRMYRSCVASGVECKLEVSGGDAMHTGKSEAAVYGAILESLGVPSSSILLESHSMNTWENAEFSAPILRAYGAQRVVLVSSATHLRRASMYFAHFGIAVTPVRADWLYAHISWWPTSWNFFMTDLAVHEYYGVFRYRVYKMFGWNLHQTRVGSP